MAHILVVEDDPDIASLLSRGLGAAGHRVDWADTVEAAADRIAAAARMDLDRYSTAEHLRRVQALYDEVLEQA